MYMDDIVDGSNFTWMVMEWIDGVGWGWGGLGGPRLEEGRTRGLGCGTRVGRRGRVLDMQ